MEEDNNIISINDDIEIITDEEAEAVSGGLSYDEILKKYGTPSKTKFRLYIHFTVNGKPYKMIRTINQNEGEIYPWDSLVSLGQSLVSIANREQCGLTGYYEFKGISTEPIYE